jgi:hypothetical protein
MLSLTVEDYESGHWNINFAEYCHQNINLAVQFRNQDIDKIR